ncbi:unnamed protein product, partial [Callosobruchus maculatus]
LGRHDTIPSRNTILRWPPGDQYRKLCLSLRLNENELHFITHDDYCTFMVSKQHMNSNGEVFSLLIICWLKLLNNTHF